MAQSDLSDPPGVSGSPSDSSAPGEAQAQADAQADAQAAVKTEGQAADPKPADAEPPADAKADADADADADAEELPAVDPSDEKPMLRPLDAYPLGNPSNPSSMLLALADPSGIAPGVVTLPPLGAAVIDLCDGHHNRKEICAEFLARYKRPLAPETLEALLKKLDDALMLDSTNFRLHCAKIFAEFSQLETRPAFCAGTRYPADAAELRALLESSFSPPNGPRLPRPGDPRKADAKTPRALLVPTVEFTSGGPAYAWAYKALLDAPQLPSLIVLLGCDHSAPDPYLTLTRKHLSTPLGTLKTDQALVDAIVADATEVAADLGELLVRDEFHHRGEHSLEYQAVWLQFVLAQRRLLGLDEGAPEPTILPILVGSLHDLAASAPGREQGPGTRVFDEILPIVQRHAGQRAAAGGAVLWLAAADLAHVGTRFGDPEGLSDDDRDSLERRDRDTLKPVLSGDAPSFLAEIRRERDRRRVLGLGPIYAFLRAACPSHGQLRCYAQCSVDAGSYISTASIVYF